MYLIRKKLKDFSAAHRLIKGYQGPCAHLHGHNYVASVLIATGSLNEFGFVIDFGEIKLRCDHWLEQHFDHATLICAEDHALIDFVKQEQQKYYLMPEGKNTSAEVIAEHLFEIFSALLKKDYPHVSLLEVEVAETVASQAVYRAESDGAMNV